MARSKIWKYFDKLDLQTAQCLLCEKIIKTCGNTSNLMKHMKTHPQIDVNDHDSVVVRGMLKRDSNRIRVRGKKMLKYASIKIKPEATRDIDAETVADMDGNIIELVDAEAHAAVVSVVNEETYANWAAAEAESATETVCAEDIIEFEPKEAQEQAEQGTPLYHIEDEPLPEVELLVRNLQTPYNTTYQDNLAYFVCHDKQPLKIIEGEGFKRLAQVLCPVLQMPSVDQLGARIAQKTQQQVAQFRQQIAQIQTLSLSCAINTTPSTGNKEKQNSYLEVAAHYHEGLQRRSRTLSVQMLPVQYNASNIVERLDRVCQRFDIDKSKIVCIVSRSSRMLETAIATLLGAQRHMPCFAHLLETIFESVMERSEFRALCDRVRQLTKTADVMSRAMGSYEMLESHLRHAAQLQKTLSSSELDLAAELLAVLAPLASAVRQLCGASVDTYPCASQALPIAFTVLNELKHPENAEQQQHQIAYELRLFVIRLLEERFEGMEKNMQLALASLLDPRYRNMPFQNASLLAKYMTHLYDLYMEKGEVSTDEVGEEATTVHTTYDIWTAFRAISHEKHKHITMNGESENEDEISSYFCTSISSLQSEPLLLWKDLSQFHPFLHSMAKKYLHIPAAAMPPARIFTAAGAEILEQHGKLLGDHMSNMLFMADCNQQEWQL
ncbi:uncharacterized protein LOC6562170 [Drosophila grimshawi]|uniref:GH11112 n=1 Tax=Drosophila grimshawi TaxID=7222 RepID=B4JCW7_DROGR|nr:uncharacterized protein LOC6562170 [Drosophila grimshawi]EDW03206.1 GH11112 [Drosophila grimshawi]